MLKQILFGVVHPRGLNDRLELIPGTSGVFSSDFSLICRKNYTKAIYFLVVEKIPRGEFFVRADKLHLYVQRLVKLNAKTVVVG